MTSWNQASKNTSSYSSVTKNVTTWADTAKTLFNQFLLKEDGGYLLLENGGKIILEQSVLQGDVYTYQTKN